MYFVANYIVPTQTYWDNRSSEVTYGSVFISASVNCHTSLPFDIIRMKRTLVKTYNLLQNIKLVHNVEFRHFYKVVGIVVVFYTVKTN